MSLFCKKEKLDKSDTIANKYHEIATKVQLERLDNRIIDITKKIEVASSNGQFSLSLDNILDSEYACIIVSDHFKKAGFSVRYNFATGWFFHVSW